MKKFLLCLLLPLLLGMSNNLSNQNVASVAIATASGGGGGTVLQLTSGFGSFDNQYNFSADYQANSFVPSSSFTATRVEVQLNIAATTVAGTMTVAIYTDGGSGVPGSLVGVAATPVNKTTFTSYATYSFPGIAASLNSGTTYYMVVTMSTYDGNILWPATNGAQLYSVNTLGAGWTVSPSSPTNMWFKIYSN